jgi:hypothetical protein
LKGCNRKIRQLRLSRPHVPQTNLLYAMKLQCKCTPEKKKNGRGITCVDPPSTCVSLALDGLPHSMEAAASAEPVQQQ